MELDVESDAPESTPPRPPEPTRTAPARAARVVAYALTAYAVVFAVWVLVGAGSSWTKTVVGDAVFLPVNVVGFILAVAVSKQAGPRTRIRRAWVAIAIAYAAWWCGDALWFAYEVVFRESPFPSVADAGYLLFYPALIAGIVALVWPTVDRRQRERLALDAGIVVISATIAVWYFVVEPTTREPASDWLATALSVAYPVGDLLLVFGVAAVLLRPVGASSIAALRFLIAGAIVFVIADVVYARETLSGAYEPGGWTDAAWLAGQVLFVWAAASHYGHQPQTDTPPPRRCAVRVSFVLPYVAVTLAYGFLVLVGLGDASTKLEILLVMATCLTGIVLTRQVITARENQALVDRLSAVAADLGTALRAEQDAVARVQSSEARMRVFLADAAHQLRSPITGIQACAEGLSARSTTADEAKLLDGILRESARAGRLVRDLLRVARIDAGQQLTLARTDVRDVCLQEVERAKMVSLDLDVVVVVDPPGAPTVASVDAEAVRQIIANLLENARRHARSRVELRVSITRAHAEIRVANDGPGIAPNDIERVFERFVTLDGSGGGLGLPIARELARAHGGDVTYGDGLFLVRLATGSE